MIKMSEKEFEELKEFDRLNRYREYNEYNEYNEYDGVEISVEHGRLEYEDGNDVHIELTEPIEVNDTKLKEDLDINNKEEKQILKNKDAFKVILSNQEKVVCLKEIIKKLKKILYVWEKSQEPASTYNYRIYCGGVLIYVSSSNMLFDGELVNIVVNLNAIMTNKFTKPQLKRIVFESVNYAQFLLSVYDENYSKDKKYKSKEKIPYKPTKEV